MKFKCTICKKQIVEGDKFRIESDKYDDDNSGNLTGESSEENVCYDCHDKVLFEIQSIKLQH